MTSGVASVTCRCLAGQLMRLARLAQVAEERQHLVADTAIGPVAPLQLHRT